MDRWATPIGWTAAVLVLVWLAASALLMLLWPA